jgi:hypothetical protein
MEEPIDQKTHEEFRDELMDEVRLWYSFGVLVVSIIIFTGVYIFDNIDDQNLSTVYL